jgi:hypothetical protein
MKTIPSFLSILILLTLGACTFQIPGVEEPTAFVTITETPFVVVAAPTDTVPPTQLQTFTDTAPPPTTIPLSATSAPQSGVNQPTATQPVPTATPTPANSIDPHTVYGEPDYENQMQVANYGEWARAGTRTLPNNRNIRLQFKDGDLYVTGKRLDFSTWWFSSHTLKDAYIEMTFNTENCSREDAYGIIFRGPPHQAGVSYGYVVAFTCNGKFWVFRLDGVDPWQAENLVGEKKNSAINTGPDEQNVIGVRAESDRFVIFANGVQVAEVEDDHFEKGRVGVFVRAARPDAYTYRVTNFAYWILGEDK